MQGKQHDILVYHVLGIGPKLGTCCLENNEIHFMMAGDRVVDYEVRGRMGKQWEMGLQIGISRGMRRQDIEVWMDSVLGVDELIESYEYLSNQQYCRL